SFNDRHQKPAAKKRRNRFRAGFLRPPNLSHSQWTTRSRSVRVRANKSLYFWADVSRGKFKHVAARQRVLDDRAGDGVLRSYRQHGSRRRVREIPGRRRQKAVRRGDRIVREIRG